MNILKRIFLSSLLLLGFTSIVMAQGTFAMKDTTVEDCWGTMTDSDAGTPAGNYKHEEDLIFSICPPSGVSAITLTWSAFQTEQCCDILRIFQGADTNGVLLSTLSGFALPSTMVINGCVTFHFSSDKLVAGTGWVVDWEIQLAPPPTPSFTVTPNSPSCNSTSVVAQFNTKWFCDSVKTGTFALTGPVSGTPTVTPVACTNDSSDSYTLTFSPALTLNGNYSLNFNANWLDVCDSVHALSSSTNFSVNDCPIQVVINTTNDTICPGQCTNIIAIASGGDPNTYVYTWNNGLPNGPGPHSVCPNSTTTYTCTVTDASPAPSGNASQTITVLPPPNAQANLTVCESDAGFNLTATPAGGTWSGTGIQNGNTGFFHPDSAGPGNHLVFYSINGGCADSTLVTVTPHDAGPDQGACPGTASFMMTGFSPGGGTWSGPFINGAGLFNPSTGGAHIVTYTNGGCSDTKTVNVQNITIQPDDTVCSSQNQFVLTFSPSGGVWSGSGITNALAGYFDPGAANIGNNVLTYAMSGCNQSLTMRVENIAAGGNMVPCPKDPPYVIPNGAPAGGYWTGPGVDSTTNIFDPNYASGNQANALVTYHLGGCTASKYMYVRIVWIGVDTLQFCSEDNNNFALTYATTNRSPGGGIWSGPGLVSQAGGNGVFNPALAGAGSHALYYTRGNCYDSLVVVVEGPKSLTDTTVCELEPSFYLKATPKSPVVGETWNGPGILNMFTGLFDPATAGVGTHQIIYTSHIGCSDTTTVTVTPQDTIYVDGLDPFYCHIDTVVNLTVYPAGGIMIGPATGNTFNPINAGQGTHLLTYTAGTGACQVSTQVTTTVGAPLEVQTSVTDDSICLGEYITISVSSAGGTGVANHSYVWNNGLSPSFQHLLQPQTTTQYIVDVSDGCSEPVSDTFTVLVNQPFQVDFDSSIVQCYGETGWLLAIPSVAGNYAYTWNTLPRQTTDTVVGLVSFDYTVRVTDVNTTCFVDATARMPGWGRILAKFSANPSQCANMVDPSIDFLEQTLGADLGTWLFGDGDSLPFLPGVNEQHLYSAVGEYTVTLAISNNGGCTDTATREVCIDPVPTHVYNTFSPNGDGFNDFFEIDGASAYPNSSLTVFNRYGNIIFERNGYLNDWDGTNYKTGEVLPDGAYFYIFDRGDGRDKVTGDVVIFR